MIYIKNVIDFEAAAVQIGALFPDTPTETIAEAFKSYFWNDERSDYWEYNKQGCQETIKDIMACFVAEQCNDVKQAAEVAITLQMQLIDGNFSEAYPAGALF